MVTDRLAAGALCGMAAGIVTGLAARIAMRMVADGVPDGIGQRPDFTLLGTLGVVIAGALAGAPIGAAFNWIVDAIPVPRAARGLAFGLLLLLLVGPLFFIGTADEFITTQRVVLFSLLFPIYGISAGLALATSRALAARLPRWARRGLALGAVLATAGSGALLAGAATEAIQERGAVVVAVLIPWFALVLVWLSRRSGTAHRALTAAR
jgi:MFS family permease